MRKVRGIKSMSKSEICMLKYERKQGNWTQENSFCLTFLLPFWSFLAILGLGQKKPIFFKELDFKNGFNDLKTKLVTSNYQLYSTILNTWTKFLYIFMHNLNSNIFFTIGVPEKKCTPPILPHFSINNYFA